MCVCVCVRARACVCVCFFFLEKYLGVHAGLSRDWLPLGAVIQTWGFIWQV